MFKNLFLLIGLPLGATAAQGNELILRHASAVHDVAVSPDSTFVATASENAAKIWDAATGNLLQEFSGHTEDVVDVDISPNGEYLLTGSRDASVKIWKISSGEVLRTLPLDGWPNDVSFSPDGTKVLTVEDKVTTIWPVASGPPLVRIYTDQSGSDYYGRAAAFSSDGSSIILARRYFAGVHSATTGDYLHLVDVNNYSGSYTSLSFSPDGRFFAAGSTARGELAKIYESRRPYNGRPLATLDGHSSVVNSVSFSSDGDQLITGSSDNTAKVWDTSSVVVIRTLEGHNSFVLGVAISPDNTFFVTGSADRTARIWR